MAVHSFSFMQSVEYSYVFIFYQIDISAACSSACSDFSSCKNIQYVELPKVCAEN